MKRLLGGLLVLALLVGIGAGLAGLLDKLLPLDLPTPIAAARDEASPPRYVDAAEPGRQRGHPAGHPAQQRRAGAGHRRAVTRR